MKDEVNRIEKLMSDLNSELKNKFVGKTVRIIKNWNGQPYGKSKKNLKGETFKIVSSIFYGTSVCFLLEGQRLYINSDYVEFV